MTTEKVSLLSHRVQVMEESQTIGMAKKARELASQGIDVVNLSFGEPDFPTPDHIKEAAKRAIDEGYTFYTPVAGYPDLKKAVCEKFLRDNNLRFNPENIVVSTGAKQSIANVILCLVDPGDEVVIIGPYWVSYLEIVKLAEGTPVVVTGVFENQYKPTIAEIEKAITPKTKAILYSSPSNPTGAVFSKDELEQLADVLVRNPAIVAIADEIYEYINFVGKHESLGAIDRVRDQVVTINGLSKGFSMTGWRLGFLGGPKWIADACDKIQGQFTSGANSITQRAAITALTSTLEPSIEMTRRFKIRRDLVLGKCESIPGFKNMIPDGAFYLFPDVSFYLGKKAPDGSVIDTSMDLCMYILNNAHVSVVPGEAFGAGQCLRISFAAADEKLVIAFDRIKEALSKLV
jgi:aspartate aminotransferase